MGIKSSNVHVFAKKKEKRKKKQGNEDDKFK